MAGSRLSPKTFKTNKQTKTVRKENIHKGTFQWTFALLIGTRTVASCSWKDCQKLNTLGLSRFMLKCIKKLRCTGGSRTDLKKGSFCLPSHLSDLDGPDSGFFQAQIGPMRKGGKGHCQSPAQRTGSCPSQEGWGKVG